LPDCSALLTAWRLLINGSTPCKLTGRDEEAAADTLDMLLIKLIGS